MTDQPHRRPAPIAAALTATVAICALIVTPVPTLPTTAAAAERPPLAASQGNGEPEPPLPQGAIDDEPDLPVGADEDEPDLPAGADEDEPKLPTGAEPAVPEIPDEPDLPIGAEPETKPTDANEPSAAWLDRLAEAGLTGFWEARGGFRTQNDRYEKDASLGETRLQLDLERPIEWLTVKLVADFVYDGVLEDCSVDLETGRGWIDLRQANVSFSPLPFMDAKIGRQILTWGTGDLLFINDLFGKDWQAFFIGRDVEYLKAPSDAAKVSLFSKLANLDVVFTPRFDADRFIRGRRLSYYNAMLGRQAGRDAVVEDDAPDEWFRDHEWAARLSRNIRGYELAAYGYWGYWKSPGGLDPANGRATFPRLSVYGASARGQLGPGIANVEAGYYDSRQDRTGDDPFVNNSQLRLLAGYEQDLPAVARDLTVGVQYYVELMMDYDRHVASLRRIGRPRPRADDDRHVITGRVTKLMMNQNLTLSLFAYYSPTDSDAYLRPNAQYRIDDHWTVEVGGNIFFGGRDHTFFGQFENNSNVYASLRCGF